MPEGPTGTCSEPGCKTPVYTDGRANCGGLPYKSTHGCGRLVCSEHRDWLEIGKNRWVIVCRPCKAKGPPGTNPGDLPL